MNLDAWFARERAAVESALAEQLPESATGDTVYQAMRYSLFAGGKRLRPLLALLAGDALGEPRSLSMPFGCALEMVHTYSLIHDDLPAMDDDDLRRGRPTCHKVYGEAIAILAGDALHTYAFEVLGRAYGDLPAPRLANALLSLAQSLGTGGMVGGQCRDLHAEGRDISLDELRLIHAGKTGALIEASLTGVAHLAGASASDLEAFRAYGTKLGLLFQVRDDLLDIEGTSATLGKTPGKDVAQGKATYPRLLGQEGARQFMTDVAAETAELAARLPGDRERFIQLANWAASRSS
jgi:geranylgeranyl diphosphate synthase type II